MTLILLANERLIDPQFHRISTQCQSTLAALVLSSQASCLNPQALVGLLVSASNTSVIGPIDNWVSGLCSQPACSNNTLASVVNNVTSGCPDEIQALGFSTTDTEEITTLVQMTYPTFRQIACTEEYVNAFSCRLQCSLTAHPMIAHPMAIRCASRRPSTIYSRIPGRSPWQDCRASFKR